MRSALVVLLLGGCLIVETHDVDENCPANRPEVIASRARQLAIAGDQIYFIRDVSRLARVDAAGGPVTDLAPIVEQVSFLAVDAASAYWATDAGDIRDVARTGGRPDAFGTANGAISAFAVDDVGVEYGQNGLYRMRRDNGATELLSSSPVVFDIAARNGRYFYTDPLSGSVRSTPPDVELAAANRPAWIVADDRGVFYYERGDLSAESAGTLRAIGVDGGEPVVLTELASVALALALDETDLYFLTASGPAYAIRRVPRTGGDVHTVACGSTNSAVSLGLDADAVFWSDALALFRQLK